jgi:hypothetical protein
VEWIFSPSNQEFLFNLSIIMTFGKIFFEKFRGALNRNYLDEDDKFQAHHHVEMGFRIRLNSNKNVHSIDSKKSRDKKLSVEK